MDLQLIVLAGAKQGTRIPLKKDKFVIGRASDCTLRAGSEAVSRRHCAITRTETGFSVRDLGSRNGTILNEVRIEAETPLKVGDELRIGPLKFKVDQIKPREKPADKDQADKDQAEAKPHDIKRDKQPPVKGVAEVVERTAEKSADDATEDDVSRWLLGIADPEKGETLKETRTISMEETAALNMAAKANKKTTAASADLAESDEAADEEDLPMVADQDAGAAATNSKESGGWGWFKNMGKGAAKKKPGKLPPRPNETSKDSREAAADILREMTRRR